MANKNKQKMDIPDPSIVCGLVNSQITPSCSHIDVAMGFAGNELDLTVMTRFWRRAGLRFAGMTDRDKQCEENGSFKALVLSIRRFTTVEYNASLGMVEYARDKSHSCTIATTSKANDRFMFDELSHILTIVHMWRTKKIETAGDNFWCI